MSEKEHPERVSPLRRSLLDSVGLAYLTSCAASMMRLLGLLILLLFGAISTAFVLLLAPAAFLYLWWKGRSLEIEPRTILSHGTGRIVLEFAHLLVIATDHSRRLIRGLREIAAVSWSLTKFRLTSCFRMWQDRNGRKG